MRVLVGMVIAALLFTALPAAAGEPTYFCGGEPATIVGGGGRDVIRGTRGNDVIHARGGYDQIDGRAGADIICGGYGPSLIKGGRGRDLLIGGGDTDVMLGGGGHDDLRGRRGSDALSGGWGRDRLRGDKDADSLTGGAGADRLVGRADADVLDGGRGFDALRGGQGADIVSFQSATSGVRVDLARQRAFGSDGDRLWSIVHAVGSARRDRIRGDGYANILAGNGGGDDIRGRGRNDVISGGGGGDRLDGGRGRDLVSYLVGSAVDVDLALGRATGQGRDRLIRLEDVEGSQGRDQLRGDSGANTFAPRKGEDLIDGRGGLDIVSYVTSDTDIEVDLLAGTVTNGYGHVDTVVNVEGAQGGEWENRYRGDANDNVFIGHEFGRDHMVEGPGDDTFIGGRYGGDYMDFSETPVPITVDLAAGRVVAQGTDTVSGVDGIFGTAFDDVIRGGDEHGWFDARGGSDLVDGRGGFDVLRGGEGNDQLSGGDFDDELDGGEGLDELDGGPGIDELRAGAGADVVLGGTGHDYLFLDAGDDTVDGGEGVDVVNANSDSSVTADLHEEEVTSADTGTDRLISIEGLGTGPGDDLVRGSGVDNLLFSATGGDLFEGRAGNDLIQTLAGNDMVRGEEGDDYLLTGSGDDDADGGAGSDTCWYAETMSSCEHVDSSSEPMFDPEHSDQTPSGVRYPRFVSAYLGEGDSATGTLNSVFGGSCSDGVHVHVERLTDAGWVLARRTYVRDGRFSSTQLRAGNTYRVRAPSTIDGTRSPFPRDNCMGAVSDTFTIPHPQASGEAGSRTERVPSSGRYRPGLKGLAAEPDLPALLR